jgi:hypothetical protein
MPVPKRPLAACSVGANAVAACRTDSGAFSSYEVLLHFKLWLTLQDPITALEQCLRKDLARLDLLARLQSVPGIMPILSMTFFLESGTNERCDSVSSYDSHCRMVQTVRLSKGKRKCTGNRKCGNRYLCWALMEAAIVAHDGVDLVPLDQAQQGLRHTADLRCNRLHRRPQRGVLAVVLLHHAHGALADFRANLPRLVRGSILSRVGAPLQ